MASLPYQYRTPRSGKVPVCAGLRLLAIGCRCCGCFCRVCKRSALSMAMLLAGTSNAQNIQRKPPAGHPPPPTCAAEGRDCADGTCMLQHTSASCCGACPFRKVAQVRFLRKSKPPQRPLEIHLCFEKFHSFLNVPLYSLGPASRSHHSRESVLNSNHTFSMRPSLCLQQRAVYSELADATPPPIIVRALRVASRAMFRSRPRALVTSE